MYEIKYCYPSSEMAKQFNRSAAGCFYVEFDGIVQQIPFDTLEDAKEHAEGAGFLKSRWSM